MGSTFSAHGDECTPLVVASMIVRDEAAVLADCLASLVGVVDRVVVCDTGSTDDTMAIAEAAGATVVEYTWSDDFAAARNAALAACGSPSWVLWIDADEQLEVDDVSAARGALASRLDDPVDVLLVDIESRHSNGITTVSRAQRLFRPAETAFVGAIHEEVRRIDGSAPRTAGFDALRIRHRGYETDSAMKAERNLSIAQAVYSSGITAKSALDLARSLGVVGAAPDEILEVVDAGLAAPGTDDHRLELRATRSNLLLELGDADTAFESASAVLGLAPHHDVAAAVYARAATDLGRDTELAAAFMAADFELPVQIPRNRAEALALAAGAAIGIGRLDDAGRLLTLAHGVLADSDDRWDVLLAALSGRPSAPTIRAITQASGNDLDTAIEAAGRVWGDEAASLLQPVPEPSLGISISFGGDRLPVAADVLSSWIPSGRRVIDWSEDPALASDVAAAADSVLTISGDAGLPAALDELIADGQRFDVAVGGIPQVVVSEVLARLGRLLDPAGVFAVWEIDTAGVAVSAVPGALLAGEVSGLGEQALMAHDLIPEPLAPAGIAAGRPVWSETSLQETSVAESSRLWIWSDSEIPAAMQMAYRASIPAHVALEFVSGDVSTAAAPLAADAPILVTSVDVVPDPRWLQAILDAHARDGSAYGPRLINEDHVVLHAGTTNDGRFVGAGEPSSAPFLQTRRTVPAMVAPYVAQADDIATAATAGTVLGSAVAINLGSTVPVQAGVGLDEMFPRPAVFLGGPAPGREHPEVEAGFRTLFTKLVAAGITPIYQWADVGADPDEYALSEWRSMGVVAIPPSTMRRDPNLFSPDPIRPRADALAVAFDPEAIVYLTPDSLSWDFMTVSNSGSVAPTVYAGPSCGDLAQRVDEQCPFDDLADHLTRLRPPTTVPVAEIPEIQAVVHQVGLTSIVIPVFNRWELTVACLDSIDRHTPTPYEVIVVDNGSSDGTGPGLDSRTDVVVITNPDNKGFPAAVNQGIAASRGEFVCVLNNDTEVTPGWLEAMLSVLDAPEVGLVGPRSNMIAGLQCVPGAPPLKERSRAVKWAREWKRSAAARSWKTNRLIGFCMVGRRSLFEELGGFDEGFGIGNFEDDELGQRVIRSGRTLRVADGAVVLHHGGATFDAMGIDFPKLMHESRIHLGDRVEDATGGIFTVVLSDGNPAAAAACAATAVPISDRICIAERGALVSTQLAAAAIRGLVVDVIPADWASDGDTERLLGSADGSLLLVVGAGERIEIGDWGAARAELEDLDGVPTAIGTPGGSEVRIVSAGPSAAGAIGTASERTVTALAVV